MGNGALRGIAGIEVGDTGALGILRQKLQQHAERLGFHRYWLAEHHNMAKPNKKLILGDDLANTLLGTDDSESIFGQGGNDTISAAGGNDIVSASAMK